MIHVDRGAVAKPPVLDLGNPAYPVEICAFDTASESWDVAASGSHAYVTVSNAGVEVLSGWGIIFRDGFESGDLSAWLAGSR